MDGGRKLTLFMVAIPLLIALLLIAAFVDPSLFLYSMLAVFLISSIVLISGKGSWYVAGYNTLDEEEKAGFTERERSLLCRYVGVAHLPVILIIISCILSDDALALASLLVCIAVLAAVLYRIIGIFGRGRARSRRTLQFQQRPPRVAGSVRGSTEPSGFRFSIPVGERTGRGRNHGSMRAPHEP